MKQGLLTRDSVIYGVILALLTLSVVAMIVVKDFDIKDAAAGLLAMIATFLGALFAFRLQSHGEHLKETARRKSAFNRAILVLGAQYNEIRTFQGELSRYPRKIERAFNMPASQPPETFELRQRIDDLSFLFEVGEAQLVLDLFTEQMRFDQAMQMVRTRNIFYVNEVQQKMAETIENGTLISDADIRQRLGDRLFVGSIQAVESLELHIEGSNESIPAMIKTLIATAKTLYPGEKFLQFEVLPMPHETRSSP